MKIQHNELSSSLPDKWQDRTMLTLVAPFQPGEFAANIVVNRYFVGQTETVENFALTQQRALKESLPAFQLLDFQTVKIHDYPACRQLHRFTADSQSIQQVITYLLANQLVYSITGTATMQQFNNHIAAFRQFVEDLKVD